jgi:hypothetical protein
MNENIYIFLDIDGVLATSHQFSTNRKKWHPTYNCYRFDEKCVKVFNSILDNINGATVILSSDWKHHYSIEQMNEIFKWNDVNAIISDTTGSSWGVMFTSLQQLEECRAHEINKYVTEHNITNWLAIDDLNLSPWISPEHFVRTPKISEGIKQSGIKDKILNILK